RTPFARIQARVLFPEEYPTAPLIVELSSCSIPQPFLRKLTKKAEEAANKSICKYINTSTTSEAANSASMENDASASRSTSTSTSGGMKGGRAVEALRVVMHSVDHNKLLPCWKELRQAATLVTNRGGDFRVEEAAGMVTLRVKSGRYSVVAVIKVPDGYPMEGCDVELRSYNFPEPIARRHLLQAREIVRRCLCGYSPALALQTSNPIKIPPGRGEKPAGGRSVQITSDHLRNLKHDVEFIKRAHDLRDVGEGKTGGKGKGNAKLAPPSTQERRAARRELKTLAKAEAVSEEAQAKKLAAMEMREQEEMLNSQLADTSQPSLLPLVDFLVNVFGWRLPQETCVACDKKVLPEDPRHPSLKDATHEKRPTRVFCGHWFHYGCLRLWMTEPPFGKDCPRCGRQVYHPDWPQTAKQLEKAWANRQAKEREIGEVREFFTVDAQFQAGGGRGDDFGAFT
ncbi:unnamed protein product, partial [Ascophyllum nodosum]